MRRTLICPVLLLAALAAAAGCKEEAGDGPKVKVPSGRTLSLIDVITNAPGPQGATARFRFLAPGLASEDAEAAATDMQVVCDSFALERTDGMVPRCGSVLRILPDREWRLCLGGVLMQPRKMDFPSGLALLADVGTPQVGNLVWPTYQIGRVSVRVAAGRAKSALNSEQVPNTREGFEAPQEGWSRGCRRAHVSFWFWLWFRQSPLAPKKQKLPPSRSPRKSWKPASTSNLAERACRRMPGGPAPTATPTPGSAAPTATPTPTATTARFAGRNPLT